MSSDMFDKTKAHRDTFNTDKTREDERRALPPETQAKVAALEKERAEKLASLAKDQERRTQADLKIEMNKASQEHPRPAYVPKFVSTWRNGKDIERQAIKALQTKYANEKTEAVREIDKKIKELTTPEREDNAKSPEAATPDFTRAATNDNWRTEETEPVEKIEAEWDKEWEASEREWAERDAAESALAQEIEGEWEAEAERDEYDHDDPDREK